MLVVLGCFGRLGVRGTVQGGQFLGDQAHYQVVQGQFLVVALADVAGSAGGAASGAVGQKHVAGAGELRELAEHELDGSEPLDITVVGVVGLLPFSGTPPGSPTMWMWSLRESRRTSGTRSPPSEGGKGWTRTGLATLGKDAREQWKTR